MIDITVFVLVAFLVSVFVIVYKTRCLHDYRVLEKIETPSILDELKRVGVCKLSGLDPSACVRKTKVIVSCSKCGKLHTITNES